MKRITYSIISNQSELEGVVKLFDMYRVFYKQDSDIIGAKQFLTKRVEEGSSIIIVAKDGDRIVGFTQLYPSYSSVSMKKLYTLNDLFVHPDVRGKRVGEGLIKYAQAMAKELGWKGMVLETATDNPAQRLYERLGWTKDDDYLHYFWSV